MKKTLVTTTLIALFSSTGFAQEMSSADNQCRAQAKEIAVQTYQTCISDSKTAKIEQIKQEYQAKIEELKKYYEAQILDLQTANAAPVVVAPAKATIEEVSTDNNGPSTGLVPEGTMSSSQAPAPNAEEELKVEILEEVPMTVEPVESTGAVQSQDLTLSEPTVTLKKAPTKNLPAKPVTKQLNNTKKAPKQIAQKRVRGQKPVKGIAKKLPAKQVAPVAQSELDEDSQVNNQ